MEFTSFWGTGLMWCVSLISLFQNPAWRSVLGTVLSAWWVCVCICLSTHKHLQMYIYSYILFHLTLIATLWDWKYYYPHFTNWGLEKWLVQGKVTSKCQKQIQTWAVWLPNLCGRQWHCPSCQSGTVLPPTQVGCIVSCCPFGSTFSCISFFFFFQVGFSHGCQ